MFRPIEAALSSAFACAALASPAAAQCQVQSLQIDAATLTQMDADGAVLVVGASTTPGDPPSPESVGAVCVLERAPDGTYVVGPRYAGTDDGDSFGAGLALDGEVFLVGAPGQAQGMIHVYERLPGPGWYYLQAIQTGHPGLGRRIALADDWACALALHAALILQRRPGSWVVQDVLSIQASEVEMSGSHMLIQTAAEVLAFELSGDQWSQVQVLPSTTWGIAIDGERALVREDQSTLRVHEWNGAAWIPTAAIDLPAGVGSSIDLSGDRLVFGCPVDGDAGFLAGCTFVYESAGAEWRLVAKLLPDLPGDDPFSMGVSVALAGESVISSLGAWDGSALVHEVPDYLSTFCFCGAGAPCANPDASRGCSNSTGLGAALSACHSASAGADDLTLTAALLPPGQSGIVFMGSGMIQLPFGDGLRCVGAGDTGVFRFPVRNSGPAGTFAEGPGLVAHSQAHFSRDGGIDAGELWLFQAWFRDPGGPCNSGFNTSQALAIEFGP